MKAKDSKYKLIKKGCPDCSADMILRDSKFGLFYGCTNWPDCEAKHGAHPDGRPLGIPADKSTREARIHAHNVFDQLWKGKHRVMKRRAAYAWLYRTFPKWVPHMGSFTIEQCNTMIAKLKEEFVIC